MLNWMLRTWWVQLVFGVVLAAGAVESPDPTVENTVLRWAMFAAQIVLIGWFFFGAGSLWEQRKRAGAEATAHEPGS
jgi:hypothetical protein